MWRETLATASPPTPAPPLGKALQPNRRVANALLLRADAAGKRLTHVQVQKLLYFVQAWGLALHGSRVLQDGAEAWFYGPIYPAIYHELKHYGGSPVANYLSEHDYDTGEMPALVPSASDTDVWKLVGQVLLRYGGFNSAQLCTLSHPPGGPWALARSQGLRVLADDAIRAHYQPQLLAPA